MTNPSDKERISQLEAENADLRTELQETAKLLDSTQQELTAERRGFEALAHAFAHVEARRDELAAKDVQKKFSEGGVTL